VRVTLGALRRLLSEAMSDDEARRRELRRNPPAMSPAEALEELLGMLPPEITVDPAATDDAQQYAYDPCVVLAIEDPRMDSVDAIADVLVDELGYKPSDSDPDYTFQRAGWQTATIKTDWERGDEVTLPMPCVMVAFH